MTDYDEMLGVKSEGEKRKAAGMSAVKSSHSKWCKDARLAAELWLDTKIKERVTGEDITEQIIDQVGDPVRDNGEPGHSNVFGSLTSRLIRDGWLLDVNEKLPMRKPKSNARKTAVYVVERPA